MDLSNLDVKKIEKINRKMVIDTVSALYGKQQANLLMIKMNKEDTATLLANIAGYISDFAVEKFSEDEMIDFIVAAAKKYE